MIIFTPVLESETKEKPKIPKYDGIKMSLEDFLATDFKDPGFKYEWKDGMVEAEDNVKFSEQRIVFNLQESFRKTECMCYRILKSRFGNCLNKIS